MELSKFKARIMQEISSNGIRIYQFPTDDDTMAKTNAEMNSQMPFAVVGSTDFVRVGNKVRKLDTSIYVRATIQAKGYTIQAIR